MKYLNYLVIGLLLLSCGTRKVEMKDISPIAKMSDSNPIYFLAAVSSIEFKNDLYYISDYEYNNIKILNRDFSMHLEMEGGESGLGINYPTFIAPINDIIGIYNAGSNKLEFFMNDGRKILNRSHQINTEILNFSVLNENIFYSVLTDGSTPPITFSNMNNGNEIHLGSFTETYETEFQKIHKSAGYVFTDNKDHIYSVLPATGEIQIHTLNQPNIYSYSIYDEPQLKKDKEQLDTFYKTSNSGIMLVISDCKVYDDKLYILIYDRENGKFLQQRRILVYNISDASNINLETIYTLGNTSSLYTKFCLLDKSQLVAFEYQSSDLHIFQLPN